MDKYNFSSQYTQYKTALPPFILDKISKAITKKYNIDDNNEEIDAIFEKYAT